MVRNMMRILWIVSLFFTAQLAGITINSTLHDNQTADQELIHGTIIINHQLNEIVNEKSFLINEHPLKVKFLKKSESANGLDSYYQFSIKNPGEGLHLLPPITLKINDKVFESIGSSYEIEKESEVDPIKLKATILTEGPLYPGQNAKAVYKIFFRGNVQLTREELPLIDAQGFIKIGRIDVQTFQEGSYNVQEITQELQAERPGSYSYGLSILEGVSQNAQGQTVRLRAQFPPVNIIIKPFPSENKPESFNGALGVYTIQAKLLSNTDLFRGDALQVEYTFTGEGPLNTVTLPDLSCQPGFSGFFQLSDLPPTITTRPGKRVIRTELRPLSSAVKEVPPLHFSFFNPYTEKYQTIKSLSFPIQVKPLPVETPFNKDNVHPTDKGKKTGEKGPLPPVKGSIANNYDLSESDLSREKSTIWGAILLIPVGAAILLIQFFFAKYWNKIFCFKGPSSRDLLNEAKSVPHDVTRCYDLLQKSAMQKLKELKLIPESTQSLSQITSHRLFEELYEFMYDIEKTRYGSIQEFSTNEACFRLDRLLESLNRSMKS